MKDEGSKEKDRNEEKKSGRKGKRKDVIKELSKRRLGGGLLLKITRPPCMNHLAYVM
jgi:hypothetical protein